MNDMVVKLVVGIPTTDATSSTPKDLETSLRKIVPSLKLDTSNILGDELEIIYAMQKPLVEIKAEHREFFLKLAEIFEQLKDYRVYFTN